MEHTSANGVIDLQQIARALQHVCAEGLRPAAHVLAWDVTGVEYSDISSTW